MGLSNTPLGSQSYERILLTIMGDVPLFFATLIKATTYRVFDLLVQFGDISHQFAVFFLPVLEFLLNLCQTSVLLVQRLVLVSQLPIQLINLSLVVVQPEQLQLQLLLRLNIEQVNKYSVNK